MTRKHVVETDPGILAMQKKKRKKNKIILCTILAIILCIAVVIGGISFSGKAKASDPINALALAETENYVASQIYENENAGGYQGKFELNSFHGYKFSTLYEDDTFRVVLIRYKLKQNKYNSYISDDLYYTLSVFKNGEMISFDTGTGANIPTEDTVATLIQSYK